MSRSDTTDRKIRWRPFGDDRLEGAAFGWTRYDWSVSGGSKEVDRAPRSDARKDPLGDGPYRVALYRLYSNRHRYVGEFALPTGTVRVEFPDKIGDGDDCYERARLEARRALEERFWLAYDAWHAPEAKAARIAEERAKEDFARAAEEERVKENRMAQAAPKLVEALLALLVEVEHGRLPDVDTRLLASQALREAGVAL